MNCIPMTAAEIPMTRIPKASAPRMIASGKCWAGSLVVETCRDAEVSGVAADLCSAVIRTVSLVRFPIAISSPSRSGVPAGATLSSLTTLPLVEFSSTTQIRSFSR
ncbi:MAG: hypothetical protein IPJ30_19605 [Acidobacteria bacterium]|nr:hypothetical protein [Acidobacteriota bacterium]